MYLLIFFSLKCIMSCRSELIHESWDLSLCCYWCIFNYGFVSCMRSLLCYIGRMLVFICVFLRLVVFKDSQDILIDYMSSMVILIGVFIYVWEFCSGTSLKEVKPLLREGNLSLYVIGKHIHVHLILTTHNAAAYTILTPRPRDVVPLGRTPSSNDVFLWLLILFIYVPLIYSYNCSF